MAIKELVDMIASGVCMEHQMNGHQMDWHQMEGHQMDGHQMDESIQKTYNNPFNTWFTDASL